ncbi:MAG: OprD family outer membrane porin [Chitinophagaceae bacterium]
MKRIGIAALLWVAGSSVYAQHQEILEKPKMYKGTQEQTEDTTSLLSAFKRGRFNGHFRYFFMATENKKGLTDYYANAAGGGLHYETARFHKFQFALSGFYIFNIGSSQLDIPDSATGQYNRYEIALFDVQNRRNKKDIDRLEELYLKYYFKNSNIVFGRQLINTPFINLQDGRMRPTAVEGFWIELNEIKKIKMEGGWLYSISPRSTTKWFDAGESIGIYPAGVNANGTKSEYANNLESNGIFMLGVHLNLNKYLDLHGWNLFAENIFNTAMLQADAQFSLKNKSIFFASAQVIRQDAVNDGGNEDPAKTYFEKGNKAITFGTKAGWKNKQWEASINYNRITTDGRYLMPREWGRDPFYTFLPRERNDGFGDVHALMGKVEYKISKARFKTSLAAGYYKMPDVNNYRLNKYGVPSYTQINTDSRYSFAGIFKGLEAQLLIVGKLNNGETYNDKKFEFNKVNMLQYNFVLNYHF